MNTPISLRLNGRLSNILKGVSFDEWCEQSVDRICPDELPVDLSKYFSNRRISKVLINSSLSFPAKLVKANNDFFIEINKNIKWNTRKEFRFIIAHEIAHTFQYLVANGELVDRTFFLPGSIEAEYFGNRIARSILLPRKLLLPLISVFPSTNSSTFSLKFINEISQKFNVSYAIVLKRLVNDLCIFNNVALLRFVKFPDDTKWRLYERYLSNEFNNNKKYYIPYRNMNKPDYISTFPSCHKKLNSYLNTLNENLTYYVEMTSMSIDSSDLADKPLLTFIKNFQNKKFKKVLLSKAISGNSIYLNVLLSLDKNDIV